MGNYVEKHINVIPKDVRDTITQRYHTVTKATNRAFWQSESDSNHTLYVGSYGRGTAVKTSDVDILCSLPHQEFERFRQAAGNRQSRLLQALRQAILAVYPNSDIRADGQVVKIAFSDGMRFELLPAFHQINMYGIEQAGFRYPDSNMGGNWNSTNPKAEQAAVHDENRNTNGLYQATCRHLRIIRNDHFSSFHLPGIVIDSFVYVAIQGWHFIQTDEQSSYPIGAYENALADYFHNHYSWGETLYSPGSNQVVDLSKSREVLGKIVDYLVQ